jgi:pimeloyl-ACP methyl ester carboxylesterase
VVQESVTTPDGRTLAVEIAGDPQGKPVLVHMGTPNSRHLYEPNIADAASRGLRLISYDRPGYGGSTPKPGRTIADCAADVRAICEFLGVRRLGVWGISGGGPHALACAALLGDIVVAVASLASPAPYGVDGLDYFAGMGAENVEDIQLALADPPAARAKLEQDRLEHLHTGPEELRDVIASLLTTTDRAALDGELAEYIARAGHEGLAPSGDGWWDDGDALIAPWGFELANIEVPVLLMHGREDMFVPFGHGEWLSANIPGVEARLLETDGHLTLLTQRVGEVHAWLAERL